MKILYHHRVGSFDGGEVVHIDELIAALRKLGHEVIVVGHAPHSVLDFEWSNKSVTMLRRFLPRALSELLELSYSLLAYHRLKAAYLRHRPDVLYERANLFLLAGVWLKRKFAVPMLLEVNAPIFHERSRYGGIALKRLAKWSELKTWHSADYVLPVSETLAEFVREAGVPEQRISVIPNAVDPSRFEPPAAPSDTPQRSGPAGQIVLGFTGFVRDWHRLDRIVDLLGQPDSRRDLRLLVVGDGPARTALERQAAELGVADRVTFAGSVGRDEVPRYVASFDVAVQPGVTNYASPLKIYEYMVLGKAIVAPDTPNIREILTDGETAVLFDPDIPGSLGAAVEKVCGDATLRARLGAAARNVINDRELTWEGNARRVEALLDALTADQNSDQSAHA